MGANERKPKSYWLKGDYVLAMYCRDSWVRLDSDAPECKLSKLGMQVSLSPVGERVAAGAASHLSSSDPVGKKKERERTSLGAY